MASIEFFVEKISFQLPNPRKTSGWLALVSLKEEHRIESLSYIFCSDSLLARMNKDFLNHDTLTDILSFDYSESPGVIQGEIYISVPRIRENARKFQQPFDKELRRVMVHGLLHFIGYKDKTATQKRQMRSKEDACLSLWK
jgi:probable rRNA maturation factor